jgi:hypothetical protein
VDRPISVLNSILSIAEVYLFSHTTAEHLFGVLVAHILGISFGADIV